jgi:hypothetical protein
MQVKESSKLRNQYTLKNWWKTAVGWGLFMWLFNEVLYLFYDGPSIFEGDFVWQKLLWWMAGGFVYSGIMHRYYKRKP